MSPRSLSGGLADRLPPRDAEIDAAFRAAGATYWVQTPCGLAGPYANERDARAAGGPLGFPVVRR